MQTTSFNTRQPELAHSDNTSSRSPLATALALAATSLGLGVVQLDITIVNTALSSIGTSLGGSVAELQWVVTAYTIAFAAFILTSGARGDRAGRLALDLSRQPADWRRRPLACLALCRGDAAARAARDRSAGTDRGDCNPRHAGRRPDRRRRARLEPSARHHGLRGSGRDRTPV